MNMVRWEPFREIVSLRDAMDRLFADSFVRAPRLWPRLGEWELPIDMYQTADDVVMKAAIPGLKPEEVDISITDDTLTTKVSTRRSRRSRRKITYVRSAAMAPSLAQYLFR